MKMVISRNFQPDDLMGFTPRFCRIWWRFHVISSRIWWRFHVISIVFDSRNLTVHSWVEAHGLIFAGELVAISRNFHGIWQPDRFHVIIRVLIDTVFRFMHFLSQWIKLFFRFRIGTYIGEVLDSHWIFSVKCIKFHVIFSSNHSFSGVFLFPDFRALFSSNRCKYLDARKNAFTSLSPRKSEQNSGLLRNHNKRKILRDLSRNLK